MEALWKRRAGRYAPGMQDVRVWNQADGRYLATPWGTADEGLVIAEGDSEEEAIERLRGLYAVASWDEAEVETSASVASSDDTPAGVGAWRSTRDQATTSRTARHGPPRSDAQRWRLREDAFE